MLGHDDFYIKSPLHETLLLKISKEIKQETIANRAGDSVKAVKYGQKVWDYLLQLMKIVGVDSIYELERSDATEYDLLFWAATFADELYSGVLKDKSIEKQQLYFYESYVNMHRGMLDRDVRNLGNIRILLTECYFKMGKAEKVDSLFKDWLTVEPEWGAGWIGWSDLYWLWNLGAEKDFNKAEKILGQGLKALNVDDQNDIKKRFKDLKTAMQRNVSSNNIHAQGAQQNMKEWIRRSFFHIK